MLSMIWNNYNYFSPCGNSSMPWNKFHEKFYIPAIQKLEFHLPHVRIFGNHYCAKERCGEFKCQGNLHDVLCRRDYAERVVSSFAHQIKSEYYGGNRSLFIEGISLEHFSELHHSSPFLASDNVSHHAVFHSFLSVYRK